MPIVEPERERAHQRRLDRQHHRSEGQEHQDRGGDDQQHHHQRQLGEQAVDTVLFQCGRAADRDRSRPWRRRHARAARRSSWRRRCGSRGRSASPAPTDPWTRRRGSERSCHILDGSLSASMNPGICIALLRTSAICCVGDRACPLSLSITSVSGSVRKPGKVLSNCFLRLAHRVVRRQVLLADAAEGELAQRDDEHDHDDRRSARRTRRAASSRG